MKYIIVFLLSFVAHVFYAQSQAYQDALSCHEELNNHYADQEKSPLKKKDLQSFQGLDFFEIDEKYVVEAKFKRTPKEKPFQMPTTTQRKPWYVKYGELHFVLDGKKCKLNVYKNVEAGKKSTDEVSLFLPFTDLTSGNESYGGGRYLNLPIPEGKTTTINFNCAYNPYCAYNENYSCPLTPSENDLPVFINAGVKAFKKNH